MKWMLIKYSQYPHWDKIQLFIQEFDVWKMWFFWKMRLEKCEFEEKKRLWKCEFCQKRDFQNVNFWINCGFLPQCAKELYSMQFSLILYWILKVLLFTENHENLWHEVGSSKMFVNMQQDVSSCLQRVWGDELHVVMVNT